MIRKNVTIGFVAMLLLGGICQTGLAVVLTGTPEDSWAYSVLSPAGQAITTTYYPQNRSAFAGAVYQGYATYEPLPAEWFYTGGVSDTMHVFETYVLSTTDTTLQLRVGGDDGHSLFVDESFVGGGGFDVPVDFQLDLSAGVARKLELVGYNAHGPSVFHIGLADPSYWKGFAGRLDDVPELYLNADGNFSNVPEPTSLIMWSGLAAMGLVAVRRRRRTAGGSGSRTGMA